jgi:hypothetical protein
VDVSPFRRLETAPAGVLGAATGRQGDITKMHDTHYGAPKQQGACPLFDPAPPAGSAANGHAPRPPALPPLPDLPVTHAPEVGELSPLNQMRTYHLAGLFLLELLAAPDHVGQISKTRMRHGIPGGPSTGSAVGLLRDQHIIYRVGHARRVGPKSKGGEEKLWMIEDEDRARRWLAAKGVSAEVPAHVEAVKPAKAEPVNAPDASQDATAVDPQATNAAPPSAPPSADCPRPLCGQSTDAPQPGGGQ